MKLTTEAIMKMMQLVIKPTGIAPVYNCMIGVSDGNNNLKYAAVTGSFNENGSNISSACRFRTGSITKVFTATVIFQLLEDGLLKSEDIFLSLLDPEYREILGELHLFNGVNHTDHITISHLLNHTSGLADYIESNLKFREYVFQNSRQQWNWQSILEKYHEFGLPDKAFLEPGMGFHYSDTNYLLLGILIESLTKMSLSSVFEELIFRPLSLKDTYLEFYQTPKENHPMIFPFYAEQSLKSINTSFDWGGGGIVSTLDDLETFMKGLMKGLLFKNLTTLKLMMKQSLSLSMTGKNGRTTEYCYGLQKKVLSNLSFYGHSGAYGSMMFYAPERELSIVLSLNQAAAMPKAEWMLSKIVEILNRN